MATKYPKVPQAKIQSLDIVSFDGGLDQRGEANLRSNSFSIGRNVMVNSQGLATHRLGLKRWLPSVVGTAGQVFPAYYGGEVIYITVDDGKAKYCTTGQTSWTDCGGDNTVTTDNVVDGLPNRDYTIRHTLLRVLDKVLILNGVDYLGYIDLATMNVTYFTPIDDPTTAPTTAPSTSITGSGVSIWYAVSFNGAIGTTAGTPIKKQAIKTIREQWNADSTGTNGITVTMPTAPSGATSWNLYLATKTAGGTAVPSDLAPLALGLDLTTPTFFDNGSITPPLDAGTMPDTNSTAGPKAKYGREIEGRPFLYGITDDEYAVLIGGDADHALDFTPANGGYRLVLNQGTNYYPMTVTGFRNGQGLPSITVLFSNTEGLSKQSIIEQNTVSLGSYSAVVWGSTEQNYGAAGVSSPYAVVNYKGMMIIPTVDGILKLDTQASLQNVLVPQRISDPIGQDYNSIRTDLLNKMVSTAWANRVLVAMPANGFDYNNKIAVYDTTRKDNECWYEFEVAANWIGTVSPPNSAGFVYVAQDNNFFRLDTMYVAQDETASGTTKPFPVELTTALIGSNTAHDGFYAVVQTVFYLQQFVGSVDLIVKWRDYQSGKIKTKTKTITNGEYAKSSVGGWSSNGYLFNQVLPTEVLTWADVDNLNDADSSQKEAIRVRVPLNNVVTNELQATVALNLDNSAVVTRSVSFQGQALGISPDVR